MHGKRAWENVGTDAPSAMTARLKRERILAAPAAAVEVLEEEVENPPRTTSKSPWQNGIAKRFVGSCRRDLLHHSIVLNERRLKRLMAEYVRYYHEDRTHLGLDKRTPAGRKAATGTTVRTKVISMPRLRGLHHRYDLAA
jgi:transposase InsO family protein